MALTEVDMKFQDDLRNKTYSRTGFKLYLRRKFWAHTAKWYMPTLILVILTWISFFIPAHLIPGRMVQ